MSDSIFSTYKTGENRVTASILAVLRCLSLPRIERILGALMEESEFQLVRFQNQPARGGKGIPDAMITSSCRLLFETKLERTAPDRAQLERHLARLRETKETIRYLLVLTPDDSCPEVIRNIDSEWLVWGSFAALNQAIDEMLADGTEVISEREAFLLRELQKMLLAEGLIGSAKDVVVVPARHAWEEYRRLQAYICQAGRAFQPVKYIAFYAQNQIYPLVPRILDTHDNVLIEAGKHSGRLAEVVALRLQNSEQEAGEICKVFLLSGPDSPETIRLNASVVNDIVSPKGQRTAFTQNQRYVALDALKRAKTTSELVAM